MWTASTKSSVPPIHRFTGGPSGLRLHKAPHIGKQSTAFSVFMLFFFAEIIQLLVDETNQYYKQYVEMLDVD
jgi:hypothetical protein